MALFFYDIKLAPVDDIVGSVLLPFPQSVLSLQTIP
jgi:hypothetical protein